MTSAANPVVSVFVATPLRLAFVCWVDVSLDVACTSYGGLGYKRGTASAALVVISFAISHLSTAYTWKVCDRDNGGIHTGACVRSLAKILNVTVVNELRKSGPSTQTLVTAILES